MIPLLALSGLLGICSTVSSEAKFTHPGVFVSRERLSLMESGVALGEEPWLEAFNQMMRHRYMTRTTPPAPFETVECGYRSIPNVGCTEEREDSLAAYTNALAWVVTKDPSKAERAIGYMNAWAGTIKTHTNDNAPLQAAWSAANWVRAAEIIRHTDSGWRGKDVGAFEKMLRAVYLPRVVNGYKTPNNWELMCDEATIGIAVFLDDRELFDDALGRFEQKATQYIYMKSDGDKPIKPEGFSEGQLINFLWHKQSRFEEGMAMEICRDLGHTSYGLASISHVAETARIQGRNLYGGEVGRRLRQALEFQTRYDDRAGGAGAVPEWLCGGALKLQLEAISEPGYAAMGGEHGMAWTRNFTRAQRPARPNSLFLAWETLTHGNPIEG